MDTSHIMMILFEAFCFLYVMIGLAYLANNFLMPCLELICRKCDLKEHTAGILLALGCSIFEMTTNVLACFNEDREMVQFGLGIIVGSGVFDFTLCFGIASVFSSFYHKDLKHFHIQTLLRDIYFYLLSLVYIVFICWDLKVTLIESAFLVALYPGYLMFTFYVSPNEEKNSPADEIENKNNASTIKKSLPWARVCKDQRKKRNSSRSTLFKFDFDEKEKEEEAQNNQNKKKNLTDDEDEESLLMIDDDPQNPTSSPQKSTPGFCWNAAQRSFKLLKSPWKLLFTYSLNYEKWPFLTFGLILGYCMLLSRYLIYSVELAVSMFPVSHVLMGLTFASWGGNISAKNCKIELATSTVIGSQIVNLQLCLGVPWLLCNILYGPIWFTDGSLFNSISAIFVIVLLTLTMMFLSSYKLSFCLGVQLIVIYVLYIVFEFCQAYYK